MTKLERFKEKISKCIRIEKELKRIKERESKLMHSLSDTEDDAISILHEICDKGSCTDKKKVLDSWDKYETRPEW